MRKIYIHAGLHKTGSTALQTALFNNRENLLRQGFYYPGIGIPARFHGHHNIAWQLSRDRRFRPEFGDVRTLVRTIQDNPENSVLLSSEDFECSLLHPQRMRNISAYFLKNKMEVCFIIYLRRQVDYLKSLYFELLKVGFGDEFSAFLRRIVASSKIEYREWEFVFNYSEINKSLRSLEDVELVFRDYDDLVDSNTVRDFCHVVGIDHAQLFFPEGMNKINERLAPATLLKLFVRNRVGALSESLLQAIDELFPVEGSKWVLSSGVRAVFEKFHDRDHFYKTGQLAKEAENELTGFNIEKVFSFVDLRCCGCTWQS